MSGITIRTRRCTFNFGDAVAAFLAQPGLPFAGILSQQRIHDVFVDHGGLSGRLYTTAVVLWAFMSQVLRDGKEASCQSAVARISRFLQMTTGAGVDPDTRDYCRARAKLPEAALHQLACEIATGCEEKIDPQFLFKNRHAKLIDGSTFMMPDTKANQAAYPQNTAQAPPGRKQQPFVVITTLFNEEKTQEFTTEDMAQLYGYRWHSELDIRSTKTHMNLHHLRCKTPAMVHREFWTTIIAYNAIRTTIASSSELTGVHPRRISFTSACQYILAGWQFCAEPPLG